MPYLAATVKATLAAQFTSAGIVGPYMPVLADYLGQGLSTWMSTVVVTTTDTGTFGVGTGTGALTLTPAQVQQQLQQQFVVNGVAGPLAPLYLLPLSNWISLTFAAVSVQTQHPTVGTGTGLAVFTSAPPSTYFGPLAGPYGSRIPKAVSDTLQLLLASATANVAIAGSVSQSPATGVGFGLLV